MRYVDPARLSLSHQYVAAVADPDDPAAQRRDIETIVHAIDRAILPRRERGRLPRVSKIDEHLRKIQRKHHKARLAAAIAGYQALGRWPDDGTLHKAAAHTGAQTPPRWRSGPPRGFDVIQRIWRPHVATVHLAIPLLLARCTFKHDLARRNPELVALSVPTDFIDLIIDDRWPLQALEVAAMWRLKLESQGLIEH